MIRTIIIDDEKNSREALRNMLENYCEGVEVAFLADSVPTGVKAIQRLQPDLIFLDIEMPVHNGFELFEFLPDLDAAVIFTTAYDQYAIKAFKFSAVDYLLKPIDLLELRSSLLRVDKRQTGNNLPILKENIRDPFRKLALPTTDGYTYLRLADIIRCEADSNYTRFFTKSGAKILVPKTLKEYEGLLVGHNFIRVHRSHLINLDYVMRYTKSRLPSVTMEDGAVIAVSVRRKEELLGRLG